MSENKAREELGEILGIGKFLGEKERLIDNIIDWFLEKVGEDNQRQGMFYLGYNSAKSEIRERLGGK